MLRLMLAIVLAALTAAVGASAAQAAPPPQELIDRLTEAIRRHCPDAEIEVTEEAFLAKSGTMLFTVHGQLKTGEILPETHQVEGPNYQGFMLSVRLNDGQYEGAAVVPQTLGGPYYPTYIDAPAIDEGRRHYAIHFPIAAASTRNSKQPSSQPSRDRDDLRDQFTSSFATVSSNSW